MSLADINKKVSLLLPDESFYFFKVNDSMNPEQFKQEKKELERLLLNCKKHGVWKCTNQDKDRGVLYLPCSFPSNKVEAILKLNKSFFQHSMNEILRKNNDRFQEAMAL